MPTFRTPPANQQIGPTFIVVGAMKAGTSTLHAVLAQHPDIFMTTPKELHYWDRSDRGPLKDYLSNFQAGRNHAARGESTPSYAFQPATAELLAKFNPELRLIFIVRDPVKRAISHLRHKASRSNNPASFDAMGELQAEIAELSLRERKSFISLQRSYHARGHYHQQISRLRQHFPERQLLVMRLEDLIADPEKETRRVCNFIGVEPRLLPLLHENKGRAKATIPAEVTEYLAHYYHMHNELLHEKFGIQIGDWIRPQATNKIHNERKSPPLEPAHVPVNPGDAQMKVGNLIGQMRQKNPKLLGDIPKHKAKALITNVFNHIRDALAETEEGVVKIPGLGQFRVKKVEREVEGKKIMRTRINFRRTEPGKGKSKGNKIDSV